MLLRLLALLLALGCAALAVPALDRAALCLREGASLPRLLLESTGAVLAIAAAAALGTWLVAT